MGGMFSSPAARRAARAKARSDGIDAQLRPCLNPNTRKQQTQQKSLTMRLLLCGPDSAAKQAFVDHARCSMDQGVVHHTRLGKQEVFACLLRNMRALLMVCPPSAIEEYAVPRETILRQPTVLADVGVFILPPDVADAIRSLWLAPSIRAAFQNTEQLCLRLNPAIGELFDAIDRIADPWYTPTERDIDISRSIGSSVTEAKLQVGEMSYSFVNVEQPLERLKWSSFFQDVDALVFFANMNDYAVADVLDSNEEQLNTQLWTRLHSSFSAFAAVCTDKYLQNAGIMLLLTGYDTLSETMQHYSFAAISSDFVDNDDDVNAVCEYISNRFISLHGDPDRRTQVYSLYTHASDDIRFRFVLSAVNDILLQKHLREQGLL
ncbi:Heterotrimeric G protein alpha subunit B [Mycena kentingensis (nom. inval.)]|nr:Heterotrimeric G protein alpha subunit B [Mycena kentingensis (nom. inval.)]